MAYEILMPQLGLTMEEGTVSQWMKHEGDAVKAGDVVAEITTDKLTHELQSERDGVLLKIVAQEGDDVPVKGILAYIGEAGERVTAAPPAAAPATSSADLKIGIVVGGGPGGYVAAIRAAQLVTKRITVRSSSSCSQKLNAAFRARSSRWARSTTRNIWLVGVSK